MNLSFHIFMILTNLQGTDFRILKIKLVLWRRSILIVKQVKLFLNHSGKAREERQVPHNLRGNLVILIETRCRVVVSSPGEQTFQYKQHS